jgi:SAM-dependent methyltransferase
MKFNEVEPEKKYRIILRDLESAYDRKVDERNSKSLAGWKLREREFFLKRLRKAGKSSLLDLGAGTGQHGEFFRKRGMNVLCLDHSHGMVNSCWEKGLEAVQLDFLQLHELKTTFDAVFAMNSLLHVPTAILPKVLKVIHGRMNVEGLFYWGQYGGLTREGVYSEDHYEPKRFFSFLSDHQIQAAAAKLFVFEDFHAIKLKGEQFHFQSLTVRKYVGDSS